jgi:hypothetical protein
VPETTAPDDFVYIKHPEVAILGGPVLRSALDVLYTGKGWVEATAEEVEAHVAALEGRTQRAETITPEEVDALTAEVIDGTEDGEALEDLARARGLDPTRFQDLEVLRDAIKMTITGEAPEPRS